MSRRADPASGRAGQNQQTIKSLLKLEGNKSCADCKRNKRMSLKLQMFIMHGGLKPEANHYPPKDPRWASWNLGIFVCIRCGSKLLYNKV